MTTPTTPKAGDITEEILKELDSIIGEITNQEYGLEDEYLVRVETILAQALAKQKESIKEQLKSNVDQGLFLLNVQFGRDLMKGEWMNHDEIIEIIDNL